MIRKLLLALVVVLLSLAAGQAASAQGNGPIQPTDDQVNAIAKKLYCPVCPNTPLDVCETKACQDWRAQIRDELASGWTEPQIIDYFVAQYGERVLAEPQRKGFTSLVWLLPVLAVALGIAVTWQVLRGWRRARAPAMSAPADAPPPSAALVDRIERELRDLD
jgi:cytochrome c-type biogenesis protein CcmH